MSERIWSVGPHEYLKAEEKLKEEFKNEPQVLERILKIVEPFKWWWVS